MTAMHIYGRFGYESDPSSPKYSQLRRCAVVGVGHHPDAFGCTPQGWSIPALRELRRRDYWKEYEHFMDTLCNTVVPFAEGEVLGCEAKKFSFARRALLGSSLSGAFTLRTLFVKPGVFGKLILASPSIHLQKDFEELKQNVKSLEKDVKDGTSIFFMSTEHEARTDGVKPPANGIPEASRAMSAYIQKQGIKATDLTLLIDEAHESMKPASVSRGISWLEEQLYSRSFS